MNMYDVDEHIAEIYDQSETYRDDVDLLLSLINPGISILEPFCGTGRILIPLAQAGCTLVGLDQAASMLARSRQKLSLLSDAVQSRVSLYLVDVLVDSWPSGFDLVVLGCNCLYELATPEEQEHVIRSAAASLKPGGYVYIDNDHMEGALDPSWQQSGLRPGFPTGACADGTYVESTIETIWFNLPARLVKFHRTTRVALPGGKIIERETIQQKHPVSFGEVQAWLERYGFAIEKTFGDRAGNSYTPSSDRAIFWARKHSGGEK
jgi:SAM-dependent methyltransferase